MQGGRSQPCEKIKDQKPFSSPYLFEYFSEHPEHEHIHENVCDAPMHKHMGDDLVWPEIL